MNFLLVCAMEKEANPFIKHFNLKKSDNGLYQGMYMGDSLDLLITGIGKQKTAISLATYLAKGNKIDEIINIGYVGSNNFSIGTICSPAHSLNYERFIPDEERYKIPDCGNQDLMTVNYMMPCNCYSAEAFVTKTNIEEDAIFDMELHSIAMLCDLYKIPLKSIKYVSDSLCYESYLDKVEKQESINIKELVPYVEEEIVNDSNNRN